MGDLSLFETISVSVELVVTRPSFLDTFIIALFFIATTTPAWPFPSACTACAISMHIDASPFLSIAIIKVTCLVFHVQRSNYLRFIQSSFNGFFTHAQWCPADNCKPGLVLWAIYKHFAVMWWHSSFCFLFNSALSLSALNKCSGAGVFLCPPLSAISKFLHNFLMKSDWWKAASKLNEKSTVIHKCLWIFPLFAVRGSSFLHASSNICVHFIATWLSTWSKSRASMLNMITNFLFHIILF